ncbi:hypothetical protein CXZ10_20880 [Pleomorphomonas diazotrophica]|uniref:Uncharacterized protein n=1 Tax=Pleomorphomonas diazotrophica TaxID=1166257 RepID=A0A1I4THM5_9HYPH|nr:hypothetical protein [Pleomorphomonas diazotrophica]PKR87258.1 hypothetical protein CXZ10_20880 [Pleomorphomonas diazotrophica]SFM76192.1 hypothetical protein SAMN05192571_105262 [Pleomorphomonas diazotrophica]
MPTYRPLFAAALAFCLSSCGAVPLTSLPSLARIDPRTTDFSVMMVALAAPRSIDAVAGSVHVEFKSRVDDAPERTDTFVLAPTTAPVDLTDMVGTLRESESLSIYALPPEEAARLTIARDQLIAERAAGHKVTASIGVTARSFCLAGVVPAGDLLITTYLRTSETQRFVPLVRDFDLASQPDLTASLRTLPPCSSGAAKPAISSVDASQTRQ